MVFLECGDPLTGSVDRERSSHEDVDSGLRSRVYAVPVTFPAERVRVSGRRSIQGRTRPVPRAGAGGIVVLLLALVMTFLALMLQAAISSRGRIAEFEARVRTLIELREAGAFGTGGFGGDKPVGEERFSVETLEKVCRIPNARHLARVDEYVYRPHIDPSKRGSPQTSPPAGGAQGSVASFGASRTGAASRLPQFCSFGYAHLGGCRLAFGRLKTDVEAAWRRGIARVWRRLLR